MAKKQKNDPFTQEQKDRAMADSRLDSWEYVDMSQGDATFDSSYWYLLHSPTGYPTTSIHLLHPDIQAWANTKIPQG